MFEGPTRNAILAGRKIRMNPQSAVRPVESHVMFRYASASKTPEPALCCPVDYNRDLLKAIPEEVITRDYGCGDPSRWLKPGETVLDLGSGTGKICFIAAQIVGSAGKVIGIDMTDEMLEVARRNAPIVAERIGYANVEFRKGRIQDLTLNLDLLDAVLGQNPIGGIAGYLRAQELAADLGVREPLVPARSIDVVVSNCVLNLVDPNDKHRLFAEIYRVLRPGGRAVISDIVSTTKVPVELQQDPTLWSGCISGALREDEFLRAFETAGFNGIRLLKRDAKPWQTVAGIDFHAVTVEAYREPEESPNGISGEVIYRGPFREVTDDAGHSFRRGIRTAVSAREIARLSAEPYSGHFEPLAGSTSPHGKVAVPNRCCG